MSSRAKVLKDRTEYRQESLSMTGRFEPLHATLTLARRPVRVFTAVVEVAALAVLHARQDFAFGRTVVDLAT
jgi:hypothetical protein